MFKNPGVALTDPNIVILILWTLTKDCRMEVAEQ